MSKIAIWNLFLVSGLILSCTQEQQSKEEKKPTPTITIQAPKELKPISTNETPLPTPIQKPPPATKTKKIDSILDHCSKIKNIKNKQSCLFTLMDENIEKQDKTKSKKEIKALEKDYKRIARVYCKTFGKEEKPFPCQIIEAKGYDVNNPQLQ